ncbi:hypothetical protein M419DRAFT_123017 [Trichoderma reesei RUT C-30]|uniref:Uncharacterized protein n=1 Tax=Hypocrea jecorina (strain ATCC 56765 / BCRC 32924 / NRRL 11460 / Rut C-30) TaxID=1344414 RepID=A0A024SCZ9_HYPJR|nr:hypothetical protein M419DRAFT_123017 [Trichoderma reesei RUT C-30]
MQCSKKRTTGRLIVQRRRICRDSSLEARKQRLLVERRTPKKQERKEKKGVVGSEARRQKYEYSGLPPNTTS